MKLMRAVRAVTAVLALATSATVWAGSIFITGHDPTWHAGFGGNAIGATNLATTGVAYARNGNSAKFLFIESKTTPVPGGNAHTAPFLTSALGYIAGDFDVMDGADLAGLGNFRTALAAYSAIVIASDHGGMLSSSELLFLNAHADDIIDYLNAGGGLYAEAESNATGLIGATARFGFLPFLVSSTDFQSAEDSNTVTAFGAGLGLTDADVNGNFSHNYFASTGGMAPVDLFNGERNRPLTLAFRGTINRDGVVPEPHGLLLVMTAALLALRALRQRQ